MQHLEEGTIHAWLDGELSADDAAAAEAHVRECAECSAAVAEARGLIAASTRILTALDDVPSGVVPVVPRKRHWYDRTDIRAAAAVLLVAGTSLVVLRSRDAGIALKSVAVSDRVVMDTAAVESSVNAPAPVANETTQQKTSDAAVGGDSRSNAKEVPAPERRRTQEADAELEKAMNARDQISRAVAQAPAPPRETPLAAKVSADSAGGMRVGALMDFARAKRTVSGAGRVEGRITDQQGKGLEGANVIVQGTTLSVGTDKEGKFKIENVPAGEQRLIARRIGYNAQTVPLSVKDTAVTANVSLTPSPTGLSEIVVTGVATAKAAAPNLKQLRADTTAGVRRTVYEYTPGVEVTLTESAEPQIAARRDERAAGAAPPPSAPVPAATAQSRQTINTISWTDRGRRYTLTGPLSTSELEAIKARLSALRR